SDNENISFFSKERPFRSPHHTASDVSVIGGGKTQKLGEVTLAHNGVLFLDELGEFKSPLIQALREPLEDEHVTVSRINYHVTYPASFLLVAASNPCPCGYSGSVSRNCICSEIRIQKYLGKFSGPFLDRIDITAEMYSLEERDRSISIFPLEETYRRIENAFLIQTERYRKLGCRFNGSLKGQDIDKYIIMDNSAEKIFQSLFQKRNLSIRRLQKIKKISRTNADLDGSENVREEHVFKALSLTKPFQFPMLAA
ncbi:MAG TPA: ATP-binding protein, partial [Leptospiraceae bacterium]|nr:ATP-binding protein [Leptospiraceae bacterium]